MVVQDDDGESLITCPACLYTTPVPRNGVSSLVTASHITQRNEMNAILQKMNDPQRISCERCTRWRKVAVCFCRQCSKFMCSQCSSSHKEWAELRNHFILTIEEARSNMELMFADEPESCLKHSEKLSLYCDTCGELVCQHCTVRMHKDHNYCVIADTIESHKKQLLDSVSPVTNELCRISVSPLLRAQKSTRELSKNLRDEIHSTFEELRKVLDETEARLTAEEDEVFEPKMESLEAKKLRIQQFQAQCVSCIAFVDGAVRGGNQSELLKSKHSVLENIRSLERRFDPAYCIDIEEENIGFAVSQDLEKVIKDSVHLYKTTITGKGTSIAEVDKPETVKLEIHDLQNQPVALPTSSIEATTGSRFEVNGDILHCDVTELEKGKYGITYQPFPTKHMCIHLNIAINGKQVRQRPLYVKLVESLDRTFLRSINCLNGPRGVAVTYSGDVFVSESDSKSVSVFSSTGEKIQTITGENSKHGLLGTVRGIAMKSGNIVVLDSDSRLVRVFSKDGEEVATSEPLQFQCPNGVCVSERTAAMYVVDHLAHCVKRLNSDLTVASTFGTHGELDGQFNFPFDIAIDGGTRNVYVTDTENHRVQVFTPGGAYLRQFGVEGSGPGELKGPIGICITRDLVFVGELYNKRVSVFTQRGDFVMLFGTEGSELGQFDGPFGLAVDRHNVLYVSDFGNKRIQLFS